MTPEEFRRYGHMVVDWVAEYLENVEKYPVLSRVAPGAAPAPPAPRAPAGGRAVRIDSARRGRDHHARHHSLAVARLLRLLPRQQLTPLRAGRAAGRRPGRAGGDVGHQPRLHRARDARAGLGGGGGGGGGPPAPPAPSWRRT